MIIETANIIINKQSKSVMLDFSQIAVIYASKRLRLVGTPCLFHSRWQVNVAGLRVRLTIEQHKFTMKCLQ